MLTSLRWAWSTKGRNVETLSAKLCEKSKWWMCSNYFDSSLWHSIFFPHLLPVSTAWWCLFTWKMLQDMLNSTAMDGTDARRKWKRLQERNNSHSKWNHHYLFFVQLVARVPESCSLTFQQHSAPFIQWRGNKCKNKCDNGNFSTSYIKLFCVFPDFAIFSPSFTSTGMLTSQRMSVECGKKWENRADEDLKPFKDGRNNEI